MTVVAGEGEAETEAEARGTVAVSGVEVQQRWRGRLGEMLEEAAAV